MQKKNVKKLVQNAKIIRHRKKIQAIISNAQAYLQIKQNSKPFANFV